MLSIYQIDVDTQNRSRYLNRNGQKNENEARHAIAIAEAVDDVNSKVGPETQELGDHACIMDRRRPRLHYGPQATTPALWDADFKSAQGIRRLKPAISDARLGEHYGAQATTPAFASDE